MSKDKNFYTYRGYERIREEKGKLSPSMEDYLEMIYRASMKEGFTKMTTLADNLNVKVSSATKIVQKLSSLGFVKYEKYGIIQMTPRGKDKGEFLLKRHQIIEKFFTNIGIKDKILTQVEMIEHHLSPDTVDHLNIINDFLDENPAFLEKLYTFIKNKKNSN